MKNQMTVTSPYSLLTKSLFATAAFILISSPFAGANAQQAPGGPSLPDGTILGQPEFVQDAGGRPLLPDRLKCGDYGRIYVKMVGCLGTGPDRFLYVIYDDGERVR